MPNSGSNSPSALAQPRKGIVPHLIGGIIAAAALALGCPRAKATEQDGGGLHWIGSWGSAPSDELASAPTITPPPFAKQTIRTVITLSAGGEAIRLRLSNELASSPLRVAKVTVARWRNGAVVPGTMQIVRFARNEGVLIPGSAAMESDPLAFTVATGEQLAVSFHIRGPVLRLTGHLVGLDPSWSIEGDYVMAEALPAALPGFTRLLLSRVDVATRDADASTVVALGDSITDGYQSSFAAERRWPDTLARLLAKSSKCAVGVVNQGISGNRVLTNGDGISAVGRLQRDVFSVPGARTLILLEGVNDLGYPQLTGEAPPSAEDLQEAYRRIATEAKVRGIRLLVGTILPFKGVAAPYFTPEAEMTRRQVNSWLRSSDLIDSVVDLDHELADPKDPERLAHPYDSGDGIHPSDIGYEKIAKTFFAAMADRSISQCKRSSQNN